MVMVRLAMADELDLRTQDEEKKTSLIEELVEIKTGDPEDGQSLKVGKNLQPRVKEALEAFFDEESGCVRMDTFGHGWHTTRSDVSSAKH